MTTDMLTIIKENPGLPIYAYVDGEVVAESDSGFSWLGKVNRVRKTQIAFVDPYGYYDRTIVESSDLVDYEEYLIDNLSYDLSDDEIDDFINNKISELKFEDVILLDIGTI